MLAGLNAIGGFVLGAVGGSFVVSVSPTSVSKSGVTRGADRTLTTAPVTVTASGGAGGYSHLWSRISGDVAITADSPSAASTTFSATLSADQTVEAHFIDTVHDASGAVLTTELVDVTIALIGIDPGDLGGSL